VTSAHLTSTAAQPTTADELAQWIWSADWNAIDEVDVSSVRQALTDVVAVMIAGSATETSSTLRELYLDRPTGSGVVVSGTPFRASALNAVLLNAFAAHALDYDDTIQGLTTHPSCHIFPILHALVGTERHDASVREFLLAYAVGIEVEGRLARALNPAHARRGWHTTGSVGTIAAAAAAAKFLGYSAVTVRESLAIACSMSSGIRANFGSPVKPLHAARAARNGLEAVLLAGSGFHGGTDPFGHEFGFLRAYADLPPDALLGIGKPGWYWLNQLTVKPYPCCGEATALVEAALRVRPQVSSSDIVDVHLGVTPFAREILEFDRPQNADQARFSAPYCVAAALQHGALGITSFDEAALSDARVANRMNSVVIAVDESLPGHGGTVSVRLCSGKSVSASVDIPKGHASVGMPEADARAKFMDCTGSVLGVDDAETLYASLTALRDDDLICERLAALATARPT
jgi:2-methylcitrate dehydratase PrpD